MKTLTRKIFKINLISPSLLTAATGLSNRASISQWFSLSSFPNISRSYLKMFHMSDNKLSRAAQKYILTFRVCPSPTSACHICLSFEFQEQRKNIYWPLPSLFSLVFQEEILSSCPLISVKHLRADLARPHCFAEFEFHQPTHPRIKWSTSDRRHEYKPQWVVSGRRAEVTAMTCVLPWGCLPNILFLHHCHPANIDANVEVNIEENIDANLMVMAMVIMLWNWDGTQGCWRMGF